MVACEARQTWFPAWWAAELLHGWMLMTLCAPPLAARTYVVHGAHATAADHHEGTAASPFKTINRAAQLAEPGDTVLVRAGIYRERVAPRRAGSRANPLCMRQPLVKR